MGCDIHMFIEYKVGDSPWKADENHKVIQEDGDDYKYLEQVRATGRDYDLFAALAGVRGSGPVHKGLPEDVCELIRENTDEDVEYGDDHSHSYSSLLQFKRILKKCGYVIDPKEKPEAFGAWDMNNRLSYVNLVNYCDKQVKKLKMDLEAEKMLLGQKINTKVQCRLIYWFDN